MGRGFAIRGPGPALLSPASLRLAGVYHAPLRPEVAAAGEERAPAGEGRDARYSVSVQRSGVDAIPPLPHLFFLEQKFSE